MKQWLSKNLVGFSTASFLNDFCHEMTTALLPSYIHHIAGSAYAPFFVGLIQGIADAASTAMKLLSGFLADRVPFYKPFLVIGYGLTSIVGLMGTTSSLFLILLYKTVAWMARGLREPLRDTWLSKIVSPDYYGRAFGFQRFCDTLGALVGPLCAFILFKLNFSFTIIFLLAIVPGLASMLPILFLTQEQKPEIKTRQPLNFYQELQQLPSNFVYFLLIMLLFGCANFNQMLFIYRAQELLQVHATSAPLAIGWTLLFYTFFNLIRGLSEFGMGALSDFYDRKLLLALFGFGLFGITTLFFMFNITQLWLFFLFFALAGMSAGTIKTLEKAHAATLLPEKVRGTGMGLLQTVDGIGDLVSSLVGALWSWISPLAGFAYAVALSFAALALFLIKK